MSKRELAALAGLLFAAAPISAQQSARLEGGVSTAGRMSPAVFHVRSDLVLVPVVVTNRRREFVDGLTRSRFSILEDRTVQPIVSFSSEDAPASAGVVLDLSGSMSGKVDAAAAAAREFFSMANPDDEQFLLTITTNPQLRAESGDMPGVLQAQGATPLVDAVYRGVVRVKAARNPHKALLVISDGMDNQSRRTKAELLRMADEADVQIYAIGIASAARKSPAPAQFTEEREGLRFLTDLAQRTGGLSFTAYGMSDARRAAIKISRAVRSEYVLGYRPTAGSASGKWRTVQVRVNSPELRVFAKRGYYSR